MCWLCLEGFFQLGFYLFFPVEIEVSSQTSAWGWWLCQGCGFLASGICSHTQCGRFESHCSYIFTLFLCNVDWWSSLPHSVLFLYWYCYFPGTGGYLLNFQFSLNKPPFSKFLGQKLPQQYKKPQRIKNFSVYGQHIGRTMEHGQLMIG